jgi:hypothetical protein
MVPEYATASELQRMESSCLNAAPGSSMVPPAEITKTKNQLRFVRSDRRSSSRVLDVYLIGNRRFLPLGLRQPDLSKHVQVRRHDYART